MRKERPQTDSASFEVRASDNSASMISGGLRALGVSGHEAKKTEEHEWLHYKAFEGTGKFTLNAGVRITEGRVYVAWVASFVPDTGSEDTESIDFIERMIDAAMAPGRSEMSDQDKYVEGIYREKMRDWLDSDRLRKLEIIFGEDGEDEEKEGETMYWEVVNKFAEIISQKVEEGKLPPVKELVDIAREEFATENAGQIYDAFMVACQQLGVDPYCRVKMVEDRSCVDPQEQGESIEVVVKALRPVV